MSDLPSIPRGDYEERITRDRLMHRKLYGHWPEWEQGECEACARRRVRWARIRRQNPPLRGEWVVSDE